ncbi:transposase [Bacteroides xylanisolvens]|nr:transposase [Bacteroides xylanisolvens]MBT9892479.1 transposase [Bacteroides xylanisolvens]
MVKIQKISEIEPRLGFTEFDMLKKYRQSFATSELGRLHALFPFSELARQMHLKSSALGRKSYFSPEGKIALMVLKSYTNFSDAQLIEHLNGNIHYQLFCGVQIDPLHPLTNPKIVSAIRQELAHRLDVEPLQLILAEHWKPYLENLHVLWEGIVWLHRHLCKHCQTLHIQRPRNKYLDVRRAYLAYSKLRKRRKSQTRMITRRLLQLLENSILPTDNPNDRLS